MKELSPLQIERFKYEPKLPSALLSGINNLELIEGEETQSVRDQEQIKNLFSNTYGKPVVTFKTAESFYRAGKHQADTMLSQVYTTL